jgi:galactose mutarotase-like enzyme
MTPRSSAPPETVTIGNRLVAATIAAKGAELVSLIPAGGTELIWSADPAVWAWHAPNLFPIVGRLADDALIYRGRHYPMKQHGFLRHSQCEIVSAEGESCALRLVDSEATRAQYPFAFALTIAWRVEGARLECTFTLANPADEPLYASLGAHPAFRWPLGDAARADHVILFDQPEPEPIRCLADGLIVPEVLPSPVRGHVLHLHDGLFTRDALIFDRPASRRIVYGAPGGSAVAIDFADFPYLGVWSRQGAGFVCLEPWQGLASPAGFAGDFADKPGTVKLPPGGERTWRYGIEALAAMPGSK